MKYLYRSIKEVALLGSTACDLHCSYCYLKEQHQNDAYAVFNRKIKQAWRSGEYFENVKKLFEELSCDPLDVFNFQLWGGEPLIQLQDVTPSIGKFMQFFPNITFFLIPTNWVNTNIDNLFDFIMEIDNNKPEGSPMMDLHLQMSIDGPPGPFNSDGHSGNWDNYRTNITKLCQKMSGIKLKHTQVLMEIHATGSKENIFKELKSIEGFKNYISYMCGFSKFIQEEIVKYNAYSLHRGEGIIAPMIAAPADMGVEDALEFQKILKLGDYVHQTDTSYEKPFGEHLFYAMTRPYSASSIIGQNAQCAESNDSAIMVNYDGTICECACSYIQYDNQYLQELLDAHKNDEYQISLIRKQYFFNPLESHTEDEIEDFNWYTLAGLRNTESTQIHLAMAMVKELALSRQVDYSYYLNPDKLLKHLTNAGQMFSCTREQLNDTHLAYLCSLNDCRKFFNGVLDHVASVRQDEGKYKVETSVKNAYFRE